jgi:hypothetical protein
LADLDGDGFVDLLSGSWPGEVYLFRGGDGRTFAAPEMIKDKDGLPINVGANVRKEPGGEILITGHVEWETTEEGRFAVHRGRRIKSTVEKPVWTTGCATAVHAVDWDGDGDLDLLVGEIRGRVYVVPNEGPAKGPIFGRKRLLFAGLKPLDVGGDAGPFAADWDGDGLTDLLVGAGDGSVWFFRNAGEARKPRLDPGRRLVPPGTVDYDNRPKEPCRGGRSKVCAADWNGDGRLDLLVGDMAIQKPDLPEPTPDEKAEHEKTRAELTPLEERYRTLVDKLMGSERVKSEEELKKLDAELDEVRTRMDGLREKLPRESEDHGWVWLFLRNPAEGGSGTPK